MQQKREVHMYIFITVPTVIHNLKSAPASVIVGMNPADMHPTCSCELSYL